MAESLTRIARPHRWDVPFDEGMSEAAVDRLLQIAPFSAVDASRFPQSIPFQGILRNDTRLCRFAPGEIVVREGDYGSSAFFIVTGSVRVVLDSLPADALGRRTPAKKGFFRSLAQLWSRPAYPEVRDYSRPEAHAPLQVRAQAGESVPIFLQDVPGVLDRNHTAQLGPGELFGEIAAISRAPRTATVIANEAAELLEIRWQGLREIRKYAPGWKEHIDRLYRERSLVRHLGETPLLHSLSDEDLGTVADQTRFESYGEFEWNASYRTTRAGTPQERLAKEPIIAREGDYPNGLILIRSGFARLSHRYNNGERTVSYLGKGDFYGLSSLLDQQPEGLPFSLRAIGYVDILVIPTPIVEQFITPLLTADKVAALRAQTRQAREINVERDAEATFGPEMIEFLVEERYVNGTATMLIDLDRCTRCDDCVRACAATHENNPRFIRHGQQQNGVMVAHACMHCVDPVCMIGCPTGAIHRESIQGEVVINDLTCIGCATCANSCPYDNIQMVQVRNDHGEFIVDDTTRTPILKAAKCDLCVDQLGGPACARACPHDALIRVDMRDTDRLERWLNR